MEGIVRSEITQRDYDLFKVIRILNINQAIFFIEYGVTLQDIEISTDRKTGKPVMVFLFYREDTKLAFDEWCNRKGKIE